jgi:hypothetical protein
MFFRDDLIWNTYLEKLDTKVSAYLDNPGANSLKDIFVALANANGIEDLTFPRCNLMVFVGNGRCSNCPMWNDGKCLILAEWHWVNHEGENEENSMEHHAQLVLSMMQLKAALEMARG